MTTSATPAPGRWGWRVWADHIPVNYVRNQRKFPHTQGLCHGLFSFLLLGLNLFLLEDADLARGLRWLRLPARTDGAVVAPLPAKWTRRSVAVTALVALVWTYQSVMGLAGWSHQDPAGAGTAFSRLFDRDGAIGHASQSILIRGPESRPESWREFDDLAKDDLAKKVSSKPDGGEQS